MRSALLLGCASWIGLAGAAGAVDVDITPSLELSETFTDNVELSPTNPESDWVTGAAPRLAITAVGPRLDLFLSGGGTFLAFANDRSRNDVRPEFYLDGTIELVEDTLELTGQAAIAETLIDAAGAFSASIFNSTGNRQLTQSYQVGPTLRHRFGSTATAELAYRFGYSSVDEVRRQDGTTATLLTDTYSHFVDGRVTSGTQFTRFFWELVGSYRENRYTNNVLANWSAEGRLISEYLVNSNFSLILDLGVQDFDSITNQGFSGGFIWDAGFRWRPGPRTEMVLTVGRRFGATVWNFDGSYKVSDKIQLQASYTEEVTTSANRLLSLLGINAEDNFANVFGLADNLTLSDEVFLSRRGEVSLFGQVGRNGYSVTGLFERRSFRLTPSRDVTYGVEATLSRRLTRRWTAETAGMYRRQDFQRFDVRADDIYSASASLAYDLGRSVRTRLQYLYSLRDSSDALFDLDENAVTLYLTMTF